MLCKPSTLTTPVAQTAGQPDVRPKTVAEFLVRQRNQDLLRFITCGSVDDGKSTLIGRMLWEAHQLFDDQIAALTHESKKYGTQGDDIDFALLVDGLAAEREQGITIDVAYRFFGTDKRRFIVADTPGHEQYTRNMVTGASTADVAVLLVDACQGLLPQTRRHAFLASLMGITHVVLAINKMDLVEFSEDVFERLREAFGLFATTLGFQDITAIPVSALKGQNITQHAAETTWYAGPTLMGYLETVKVAPKPAARFVFPVQCVNRPNADFRGFSGRVAQGTVCVGDAIRVTASGQVANVSKIVTLDAELTSATEGDAITLCLDREIDASRGDVISLQAEPLETSDQFEVNLVWMAEEAGLVGRSYELKHCTEWVAASITNIKYRIDINTLAHVPSKQLGLNDICVCTIALGRPIASDSFAQSKSLGGFILVDRFTHATVAAGMIRHNLRRAKNIHRQALTVTRQERERLNGHESRVIWFTGLSGSGKSTLANALEVRLHGQGLRTYILDGDNVRQGLNKDLGFTDADRVENIRRVVEVAKLMMDAGIVVITAFISPFRHEREMARELIGKDNFLEIYVGTPLDVCEQRDPKGLYKKARAGKLPNMSGIGSPYEPPENPDLILSGVEPAEHEIDRIIERMSWQS